MKPTRDEMLKAAAAFMKIAMMFDRPVPIPEVKGKDFLKFWEDLMGGTGMFV